MRWPWQKRKPDVRIVGLGVINSPFDKDVIGPGDPGYEVFERAMRTGKPVLGSYDPETGEVVAIRELDWPDGG